VRRASTLAAVLLLAACGLKTPPLPPEKVQPLEATSLVASSTTGGVQLVWRRPTNYTGGKRMNDLGGFEIERAGTTEDFVRIGDFQLSDEQRYRQNRRLEWTDASAVPGATYRYRIIAYTLDGYRSTPAGPVEVTFTPP
jgi:hypothetical protein